MNFNLLKWSVRLVLGFIYGATLYHFGLYIVQGGLGQASWVSAAFSVLMFVLFSLGMFALLRVTNKI